MFKCRHRESGEIVAIKRFKLQVDAGSPDSAAARKTAVREVQMLRLLRHDHIVALLDVFRQGGRLYLCFEYLEATGARWCRSCRKSASWVHASPLQAVIGWMHGRFA